MRNRAKCGLCGDILESFHRHDWVKCKCGEISIDGGNDYFKCSANNFKNFIRLNDDDSEVPVEFVEPTQEKEDVKDSPVDEPYRITKKDLLDELDRMIKNYESLPQRAMEQPINHYDLVSVLLLASALFKAE